MNKKEREERNEAIIKVAQEVMAYPNVDIALEEILDYDVKLKMLFEKLLVIAIKNTYYHHKGGKRILSDAVGEIIDYRHNKFNIEKSIWMTVFHLNAECFNKFIAPNE